MNDPIMTKLCEAGSWSGRKGAKEKNFGFKEPYNPGSAVSRKFKRKFSLVATMINVPMYI